MDFGLLHYGNGNVGIFALSDKLTIILVDDARRERAIDAIRRAPVDYSVVIGPKTRTLEQNARLWALLRDIANQVDWHGNRLTEDEWKDVFTAALKRQKVVPGIDGGFVVIGARTSKMNKREVSDLMELISAFGADHDVKWGDTWGR